MHLHFAVDSAEGVADYSVRLFSAVEAAEGRMGGRRRVTDGGLYNNPKSDTRDLVGWGQGLYQTESIKARLEAEHGRPTALAMADIAQALVDTLPTMPVCRLLDRKQLAHAVLLAAVMVTER